MLKVILPLLITVWRPSEAHMYKIIPDDELFVPCPNEKENFVTKYVNLDNFQFKRIDDDTMKASGNFTFIYNFKNAPIKGSAKVERKVRGTWTDVPYRLQTESFCTILFDPTQPWYKFVSNFHGELRKCPPIPGVVYTINTNDGTLNLQNFPSGKMDGQYRVTVRGKCGDAKLCVMIYGEIVETK